MNVAELPYLPLQADHEDFELAAPVVFGILEKAGGLESFARDIPPLIRKAIDEVIDTARTNRFTLSEIEKTEKTYLGTKVEIVLRAHLKLTKGRNLDLSVRGADVDIKNTIFGNWTIPLEAVGHPCVLVKENERTARFSIGVIIANRKYLNPGKNRDSKRTFSVDGLRNIWWLLKDHPYPPNLWETMSLGDREKIMAPRGGAERLATLFRLVQQRPVIRLTVEHIAQQKDALKRLRRNGGARDILAREGTAILWGRHDRALIAELELPPISSEEFVSYTPTDASQISLLRAAGHID